MKRHRRPQKAQGAREGDAAEGGGGGADGGEDSGAQVPASAPRACYSTARRCARLHRSVVWHHVRAAPLLAPQCVQVHLRAPDSLRPHGRAHGHLHPPAPERGLAVARRLRGPTLNGASCRCWRTSSGPSRPPLPLAILEPKHVRSGGGGGAGRRGPGDCGRGRAGPWQKWKCS